MFTFWRLREINLRLSLKVLASVLQDGVTLTEDVQPRCMLLKSSIVSIHLIDLSYMGLAVSRQTGGWPSRSAT